MTDDDHLARGEPGQTPGGGWVPIPDPTTLTTEAVERATVQFRREMAAMRELLTARLDAMESTSGTRMSTLVEAQKQIQADRDRDIAALRDVIEARLHAMDKANELLAASVGKVPTETDKAVSALRELLGERIDGMDEATKLLASNVTNIAADIDKSALSLKAIIDTRLSAMDEATKLLATNVDKVPYAILQEAGNLKAFIMSRVEDVAHTSDEKFRAVEEKFASNALALAAALAAQEKAVAEQNRSNTLAIGKSESSTKETIAANAAQAQTGLASLAGQLADLKDRVVRIESSGVGAAGQRTEQRLNTGSLVGVTGTILALVAIAVTIIIATRH